MKYQGKGVSSGVALGKIRYVDTTARQVNKVSVADTNEEQSRFEEARIQAMAQLGELAESSKATLGEENAQLFETHQMMLDDSDFIDGVTEKINSEKICAEYAVQSVGEEFAKMFAEMDDAYMRERAADIRDVSRRVTDILTGKTQLDMTEDGAVIMAAVDFAPSETAQFDREKVLAIVTKAGAGNSHTAIFARTMGIPAIIGLGESLTGDWGGKPAVLDGDTGELILEPDENELMEFQKRMDDRRAIEEELESYRGKPSVTTKGQAIKLCANIGSVADAALAMENDAEGVGLFRSEFLYLESDDYPDEEKQFKAYRAVAEKMAGRPVIIRTLDIGADKQADYFMLPHEENPAMGMRAIRICLTRPEIFKTQLRAIYRASVYGKLLIMFPMIASVKDLQRAKAVAAEVRHELEQAGVDFDKSLPVGIMVETPAAAIISDLLAREADFFSLGTNDLTQYTLAVDRQNQNLEEFCDTRHEAVLRLIALTVENAHKNGIWAGICGELAADAQLLDTFLKMGVDELSVSPSAILPLRKRVINS